MPFSTSYLSHVQPYEGKHQVHTTFGEKIHLTSIGDVHHSLPLQHVFLSPCLSTNLVSVGQAVDNHCNVSFSSFGCVVQHQESKEGDREGA